MSLSKNSKHKTIWEDSLCMPKFNPLSDNTEVDVCIVGGGIAGLTTAYLLTKEGKRVCVLEDAELCSGQTGRTTAQFVTALDDRFFEIERLHGEKGAKIAAESHATAIEKVKGIVRSEKIECEMEIVDGFLFAADDKRKDVLQDELKAITRAGLANVKFIEHSPLAFFDTGPCLQFSQQMQLHPLKYLSALTDRIVRAGSQIYTNTHVNHVKGGKHAEVKTDKGFVVHCKSIVMATNTPVNDLFAIHTKQAAYRTYVLGFDIPKGSIPNALFWDTLDPYHYVRLEQNGSGNDILVLGGEDHKTGQDDHPEARFEALEKWVRARYPMAGEVLYRWSGQIMEPVDGMGFLGHNPMDRDNVYVITGDSGNGMTHCTIGAMLVTDQIMGRENPWEDLYNPSRISMHAVPEYMKENANVAAQYVEWLEPKSVPNFEELFAGEGVVFRKGVRMIAAYKDDDNKLTFLSSACPHLGGVIHWNNVEKSWDCPCHGSRFEAKGKVIEGPAWSDLARVTFPEVPSEAEIPLSQTSINKESYPGKSERHPSITF
ncbi:MAG: hypothetical protein A2X86_20775 [Bdellovibrionales bacterium GWA2_49_15]|nr:MAG: hypothetical protein A2X86_20775 [Bdellovibrionales bacterium GWA2_49_15]HAZ13167.1 FAD-dependent oxidoreductase [Bdellovibrionales bacterium]